MGVCPIYKCKKTVSGEKIMCAEHWSMLTEELQHKIADRWRRGGDSLERLVSRARELIEGIEEAASKGS